VYQAIPGLKFIHIFLNQTSKNMKNRILLVFSLLGILATAAAFSLLQKPVPLFNQSKELLTVN